MREIGKVLLPMVTPFKANGDVDTERVADYARWLVEKAKGDSLIVSGTTGEFPSLSFQERVALFETVWDAVGKQVPIIAGTGCASTRETIALTQEAERIGMDLAMVVAPFYAKPDQEGILDHYRQVAAATRLPILLYNIPLFTGVNIEPESLSELAKLSNIMGIKEESGINPLQTTRYLMTVPEDFRVYVGDDTMVLPIMAQGGAGAVSGCAQVCGPDMSALIKALEAGNLAEARKLHRKTFAFFEALYQNGRINPIPILRAAIGLAGFDVGGPRPPLRAATRGEVSVMSAVMKNCGYLAD